LANLRQSTQTLVAEKTALEPSDVTALASLNAQREQQIATLANQILNSVSAATAVRLRVPGHILATGVKATK
jgi:deferrochelatase/peroxidase EfeB